MASFTFSKIVILESLDSTEYKSGSKLCKFINSLKSIHPGVPDAQLVEVAGKDAFVAAIATLIDEAESTGEGPILQIEMHGWEDKSGLAFSDGSELSWDALGTCLSDLNRATRFNLVICLATCYGAHFIEALRPSGPSPCFAMIGPTESMYPDELLKSFKSFYEKLLTERDASAALEALHQHQIKEGGFMNRTAEDWFFKISEGYLQTHCTAEELKRRSEAIIGAVLLKTGVLTPEQKANIARLGKTLANGFLDQKFPVFFMTDTIPENIQRFGSSLDAAKQRVEAFFNSQGQT